jgi:hypothetical protein
MAVAPGAMAGEAVEVTKAVAGTAAVGIAAGTAAAAAEAATVVAVGAFRECTEEVRMES